MTGSVALPTPSQLAAIDHGDGPALVLAGPGSGKTFVLAQRTARLVASGISPERVLLLTFARNAAEQLRALTRSSLASAGARAGTDPQAITFDAFAQQITREYGRLIHLPARTEVLGDAGRLRRVAAIVDDLRPPRLFMPLQPAGDLNPVIRVIEHAKQEQVTPQALGDWAADAPSGESASARLRRETLADIARVYAEYQRLNRASGTFDFQDYVLLAVELLGIADVRAEVSGRYDYVMVDEYQDTSEAQGVLAERVAGERANLLVVLDDDQAIYKFRGASRHNLYRFVRAFPAAARYPLRENRRSTASIVRASLALMSDRQNREPKELEAIRGEGYRVRVLSAPDVDSEALAVAESIARAHIDHGIGYRNVAVLGRTRTQLARIVDALRERGVPYLFPASRDFFRRPEVKDAISLLAVAADPDHDLHLTRLAGLPSYAIGPAILGLGRTARMAGVPLRTLTSDSAIPDLRTEEREAFARLVADVEALAQLAVRADAREVLQEGLARTRYVGVLDADTPFLRSFGAALLRKLDRLLAEFCDSAEEPTAGAAVNHLELLDQSDEESELPALDVERDAVQLLTVHSAKGLEFPHVFVVGLTDGDFPLRERHDSIDLPPELAYREEDLPADPHEDEERRLLYVAMTRAMDSLTLSFARREGWRRRDRSTFLASLAGHRDTYEQNAPRAELAVRPPLAEPRSAVTLGDLSYSHLSSFARCPRRFAYEFVYRLPRRSDPAEVLGDLVHDTLYQAGVRQRAGEMIDVAALGILWDEVWAGSGIDRRRLAALHEDGRAMVTRYGETPGWRDRAFEMLEEPFSGLPVGPHRFVGKIDRVDAAPPGGRRTIIDYKTGRPRVEVGSDERLQFALYAAAASMKTGDEQFALELHYVRDGSVLRVEMDRADHDRALVRASRLADEIRAAVLAFDFVPAPARPKCSRCPFRAVCDEGVAALSEAAPEPPSITPRPAIPGALPF